MSASIQSGRRIRRIARTVAQAAGIVLLVALRAVFAQQPPASSTHSSAAPPYHTLQRIG